MDGNASYQPAPGYGDRRHFLGPPKSPVWFGLKREVPELLTNEFWRYFMAWRMFNIGAGFPEPGTWVDQDPVLIECLLTFEEHHRRYFSHEHAMIEAHNSIIRLLAGRRH